MLTIKSELVKKIIQHAKREHPLECCGVLAGCRNSDRPERFIEMRNAAMSQTYFEYDAKEQFQVWQDMDDNDEEPVVIYHSHTNSVAYPSKTDVLYANEPFAHFVIVSTDKDHGDAIRSFRVIDDKITEETIAIVEHY